MRGPKDYLKLGDQNAYCDECGFKFKLSELLDRWDGAKVDRKCWEPRHPRDYPQLPRTEQPPQPGTGDENIEYTSVTFSTNPSAPSGTFSGTSGHSAE